MCSFSDFIKRQQQVMDLLQVIANNLICFSKSWKTWNSPFLQQTLHLISTTIIFWTKHIFSQPRQDSFSFSYEKKTYGITAVGFSIMHFVCNIIINSNNLLRKNAFDFRQMIRYVGVTRVATNLTISSCLKQIFINIPSPYDAAERKSYVLNKQEIQLASITETLKMYTAQNLRFKIWSMMAEEHGLSHDFLNSDRHKIFRFVCLIWPWITWGRLVRSLREE